MARADYVRHTGTCPPCQQPAPAVFVPCEDTRPPLAAVSILGTVRVGANTDDVRIDR